MDMFSGVCMVIGFIASTITIIEAVRAFSRYIAKRKGSSDAGTSNKPDGDCVSNQ